MNLDNPIPSIDLSRAAPAASRPVEVGDVMKPPPPAVRRTTRIKDIAQVMLDSGATTVPVVDGATLVGVVSESDLIVREGVPTIASHYLAGIVRGTIEEHRHHWDEKSSALIAEELMATPVVVCEPDEPLALAVRRMLEHDLYALPVVEGGRLVGYLSERDCLRPFVRPDADIARDVEAALAPCVALLAGDEVHVTVRDGMVSLRGWVGYESDAREVVGAADAVLGVIQVLDHLGWEHAGNRVDPRAAEEPSDLRRAQRLE